ncbi:hypothetical protein AAEO56_16865 [Flavobacterium sp. DGU11]|uniref:Outer membrane protein beta-barrel domain-containing protein n=1 Tax=Flavobacterium arundinis TaxID=3139143 RepID=A0ABU9I2B0_9FLAO
MKKYISTIKSISAIAFTGLWIACPNDTFAQNSEISASIGGISSSLNYKYQTKDGENINIGIEYAYYFSENIGIAIGAEYQRVNASSYIRKIDGSYNTADYEQEPFEFRYTMNEFSEQQKINFLNIPVAFVYRTGETGIYARVGAKVGLPVSGSFSSRYLLSTSGFYPQYNAELSDPLFMGFGDFGKVSASGNSVQLKPSYIASFELGIKESIGKNNFYAGFYLDYGLNNIAGDQSHPVEYVVKEDGAGFKYNSILNSPNIDSVKTLAFGVKLRYSFLNF